MRVITRVLTLSLMIVLAGIYVFAGDMLVKINRPFIAGGKNFPAGHYRVIADNDTNFIELLNLDRNTTDRIQYSSRLSPRPGQWGEVIFDEVGNKLYLSEVYIIGMDGFYIPGAAAKHKHVIFEQDVYK